MARLKLSKSGLAAERSNLKLYREMVPSLDLKRRQLGAELDVARGRLREKRSQLEEFETQISAELPMLANPDIRVSGLVSMSKCEIGYENVAGVRLPRLAAVEFDIVDYALLSTPAWVDLLVERLTEVAKERIRLLVLEERVRILQHQVKRVTQRVNLFDQILIPRTKKNIQRISILLGDQERAAVTRAKLAKQKGEKARAAAFGSGSQK
ncbi:MAG: V-type ATP synthase subunit D [Myxococcota bacterium]